MLLLTWLALISKDAKAFQGTINHQHGVLAWTLITHQPAVEHPASEQQNQHFWQLPSRPSLCWFPSLHLPNSRDLTPVSCRCSNATKSFRVMPRQLHFSCTAIWISKQPPSSHLSPHVAPSAVLPVSALHSPDNVLGCLLTPRCVLWIVILQISLCGTVVQVWIGIYTI
jgi:hypothetical protein